MFHEVYTKVKNKKIRANSSICVYECLCVSMSVSVCVCLSMSVCVLAVSMYVYGAGGCLLAHP